MRRPLGSGSVMDRGDGSFLLRWRDRGERPGRVVRCTGAEAHEQMDAIMLELARRGHERTFAEYASRWLDDTDAGAASRSRFRRHLEPEGWARLCIGDVRQGHMRRWLDKLKRDGMGQQQRRHCAYLASAIFRAALEEELVDRNPVAGVRKPPVPPSRKHIVLTAAQVEAQAARTDVRGVMALTLIGCCLRPGELFGLTEDDDRGDHLLISRSGRKTLRTKTGKPRRVELVGWGKLALERWRALREDGGRWLYNVPAAWMRDLGLPAGVHAHDCRGTGATHLLSGTWGPPWTIAEVAAFIGDSIATTERAYAHLLPGRHAELGRGILVGTRPDDAVTKAAAILGRASTDSDRGPLASEACEIAGEVAEVISIPARHYPARSQLSELARRYAQAVADGDPHRDMRGLDLAEAVLRLDVAIEEGTG